MPPFFFLCNYHGNVQELGQQMAEVKLSVSIMGNPDNYIPGKVYQSKWMLLCSTSHDLLSAPYIC